MNEFGELDGVSGLKLIAQRMGAIFLLYWVVTVVLHLLLRHSHLDQMLLMVACWSCLPVVRLCMNSTAKFRWAACGIVSLMTFALAIALVPFGLSLAEGLQSACAASISVVIIVWLCTYLLRVKVHQLERAKKL